MPRRLTFKIGKTQYETIPVRVDRRKLYGWTELTATDDDGIPCRLLSSDEFGKEIIGPGGTGTGILSDTGRWVERSELRIVDADGKVPKLHRSNFKKVNRLVTEASAVDLLDYSITDFYYIEGPDGEMTRAVGDRIYMLDFAYNDSYDPATGFVLAAADGLFLLLGMKNHYEFLCFGDCENIEYREGEDGEEEDEDLDFSMF